MLAARDVKLHMFTNPTQGVRSNADFSNFQRQATIDCLAAAGLSPSLVGALLSRGKLARNFDVEDIARPGFVQNFFIDAVRNVAKCQLRKKRQAADPNCVQYKCSSTRGCFIEYTCATGCDQCRIGGQSYRSFDQDDVVRVLRSDEEQVGVEPVQRRQRRVPEVRLPRPGGVLTPDRKSVV